MEVAIEFLRLVVKSALAEVNAECAEDTTDNAFSGTKKTPDVAGVMGSAVEVEEEEKPRR